MKSNKCNLNETFNGDKSFYDNESSDESNKDKDKTLAQKKRVVNAEWNTRESYVQEL